MRDRSHLRARGRAGRGSLERRLGIGIAGEFHQCITGEQFSVVDPLNANLGETALGDLVPLGSVAETVVAERDLQIELAFRILGRGLLVDRRRLAVGGQRVLGLSSLLRIAGQAAFRGHPSLKHSCILARATVTF